MKILNLIPAICLFLFCTSCLKNLDEKKIKEEGIEVNWYHTSSITTVHEHVEVSKWYSTKKIAELNAGGIDGIRIENGQIIIKTLDQHFFYQLDKEVFGFEIVLDCSGHNNEHEEWQNRHTTTGDTL